MSREISTTEWKFNLGDKVRDRVSRLEGIVTSRYEHLNGCKQYGVNPGVDKDGKMMDSYHIDGEQLDLVDEGLNKTRPVVRSQTGGAPSRIEPNVI